MKTFPTMGNVFMGLRLLVRPLGGVTVLQIVVEGGVTVRQIFDGGGGTVPPLGEGVGTFSPFGERGVTAR
jgi:hypothetical protein